MAEPFWQTNDDVGMLSVVHQFGDAVEGTPPWLIHTNIFWAYLLRAVPEIGGIVGYVIASYLVMAGALIAIHTSMQLLGVGIVERLLTTSLFISWLVLFPQFTMTAGISAVAAAALIAAYQKVSSGLLLGFACLFALTGWLIRDLQFLLVMVVATPFLISGLSDNKLRIAAIGLIIVMASSWYFDHQSYQDDAWRDFNELNLVRTAYTDFGLVSRLIDTELAAETGYSNNDLHLLRNWFFVDPALADPQKMQTLLEASPPRDLLGAAADLLDPFYNYRHLWALVLATIALSLLSRSRQVALAWIILLAAIYATSLAGRLTPERVIIPVYAMICFYALTAMTRQDASAYYTKVAAAVLMVATIGNAMLLSNSQAHWQAQVTSQEQIARVLTPRTVVWGEAYKSEIVHRPLQRDASLREASYQSIGLSSLAPTSNTFHAKAQNVGPLDLLRSQDGVRMVAFAYHLRMLEIYCREHLGRVMETPQSLTDMQDEQVVVIELRCVNPLGS